MADAKDKSVNQILEDLPGGGKHLPEVHDHLATDILNIAEELFKNARSKLGKDISKPRVHDIAKLFESQAGKPRKVPSWLDQELRKPEHAVQVAPLDEAWDKTFATAVNDFDVVSVSSGSKVQDAYDKWTLAVRLYKSESRSAAAIFKADVELARQKSEKDGSGSDTKESREQRGAKHEVDYYTRASEISTALVTYEGSMKSATSELATALGALIQDLFDGFMDTAVGEATLIDTTQSASQSFWSSVDSELNSRT